MDKIPEMPELVEDLDEEAVIEQQAQSIKRDAAANPRVKEDGFAKKMRERLDDLDKQIEDINADGLMALENAQGEYDATRKMMAAQIETQVQSLKIAQDGMIKLDADFAVTRGAIIRQSQEKVEACERGKRGTQAYLDVYDEAG